MKICVKDNIKVADSIEAIGKSVIFNSYFRGDTITIKDKNEFKRKKSVNLEKLKIIFIYFNLILS